MEEDLNRKSWGSFEKGAAKDYLKGFGQGSINACIMASEIIKELNKYDENFQILDLGCGNGQFIEELIRNGVKCNFTGVDFSDALINAAGNAINEDKVKFINDDIHTLKKLKEEKTKFDLGIYSHVLELISSPGQSIYNAKKICDKIMIRFYEPPKFKFDSVEIKEMRISSVSDETMPYLRRKMSKTYYRDILSSIGCKKVEVYKDHKAKDEIHLLYF